MTIDVLFTLVAIFLLIGLVSTVGVSAALSAVSPERRRLRQLATAGGAEVTLGVGGGVLAHTVDPRLKRLPLAPKSPKDMNRLRRQLVRAGYDSPQAMFFYVVATLVTPVVLVLLSFTVIGMRSGWVVAMFAAAIGYLLPGILLAAADRPAQDVQIREDGLPDALDLLIVCVEAGMRAGPGDRQGSRRTRHQLPGARLRAAGDHDGNPRRQATRRGVQELCRANQGGRRAVAGRAAGSDRQVRHQPGPGAAHARRHVENQAPSECRGARGESSVSKLVFPLVLFLFPALLYRHPRTGGDYVRSRLPTNNVCSLQEKRQ